jgi:chromosome segregation ATPase
MKPKDNVNVYADQVLAGLEGLMEPAEYAAFREAFIRRMQTAAAAERRSAAAAAKTAADEALNRQNSLKVAISTREAEIRHAESRISNLQARIATHQAELRKLRSTLATMVPPHVPCDADDGQAEHLRGLEASEIRGLKAGSDAISEAMEAERAAANADSWRYEHERRRAANSERDARTFRTTRASFGPAYRASFGPADGPAEQVPEEAGDSSN